jgi:hypothetical protein
MSSSQNASDRQVKGRTSNKLQKELTEAEKQKFGAPHIAALFANTELNEIWEDYIALNFYLLEVHRQIKAKAVERVVISRLVNKPRMQQLGANAIYGIINRIRRKRSGLHAFIDAISLFEHFMSMLVFKVYLDFPAKLKGLSQQGEVETGVRQQKLIDVIFESSDRHEMIHKLVEEKVRGIFYGNPIDLFAKD